MSSEHQQLILAMIDHEKEAPHRIHHFIKVHGLAKLIGEMEDLQPGLQRILETAALVHDIGIKPSLAKYGSSSGHLQELEGPKPAMSLLLSLNYPMDLVERVGYLVSRHHTYTDIDGPDYQILVEADFLVNFLEENTSPEAIHKIYSRVFSTPSGKRLCRSMYG